jgi:hypothetical protein
MGKILRVETEDRDVAFVQFKNHGVGVHIVVVGNNQDGGRHSSLPKFSPEGRSRTFLVPASVFFSYPFNPCTKAIEGGSIGQRQRLTGADRTD